MKPRANSFSSALRRVVAGGLACAALFLAESSSAQEGTTAFVSFMGDDAKLCLWPKQPCRSIEGAMKRLGHNDSIVILDPNNFGDVRINKGVTIIGVEGAIFSKIIIDVAAKTSVNLQNITIKNSYDISLDNSSDGVVFLNGGMLSMKNCNIINYPHYGIFIQANDAQFLLEDVLVSSSALRHPNSAGIVVWSNASGVVRRATVGGAYMGMRIVGAKVTVADSVFSNNGYAGIYVGTSARAFARLQLERTTISNNPTGLAVLAGAQAFSARDNFIVDNNVNVSGVLGTAARL